ncbi:hypothetical protein H4582DRAFT_2088333 [Lactarius indigo]|nr:hypothetical protein H4582DRAFT_2065489 [Lactarius indigo]KAI9429812.1 hypothetical protein H4582DRAFT_2088333 [Lactarius indigo]
MPRPPTRHHAAPTWRPRPRHPQLNTTPPRYITQDPAAVAADLPRYANAACKTPPPPTRRATPVRPPPPAPRRPNTPRKTPPRGLKTPPPPTRHAASRPRRHRCPSTRLQDSATTGIPPHHPDTPRKTPTAMFP